MFIRLMKTFFLIVFIFLSYESFFHNMLKIASNEELLKVNTINSRLVTEIVTYKVKNSKFDNKLNESKFKLNSEKFFNYSLSGMFVKGVASTFKLHDTATLIRLFNDANKYALIVVLSCLLVWLNIEFGFIPALLSGLAILLSPFYNVLSGLISHSIFSLYLPAIGLSFLLLVERLKKTYIQKQITMFLFLAIMLRLWISYRNIFFVMFSCLVVGVYHSIYYKWEKKFAINRVFSFCQIMFFSFLSLCAMQIGLDIIINKNSFANSFFDILENFQFIKSLNGNTISNAFSVILNDIYIYPHINCLSVLIFFAFISLISFLFYYKIMKVHQRRFYALFMMTLASYLMVFFSAIFEISNHTYLSAIWMYPGGLFTFAILGLLISNVYNYRKKKSELLQCENNEMTNKS